MKHKFYKDKRAKNPYFIYRVFSRKFLRKWCNIVEEFSENPQLFQFILQGLFAAEGNVKFIERTKSRVVRISQGKPNPLLEKILSHYKIVFNFSKLERSYIISGRDNLEKIEKLRITILDFQKNRKFKKMMNSYKQRHYRKNQLKMELYTTLSTPHSSLELSKKFNRSQSRITRVLCKLKKEDKVRYFRVGSKSYWIRKEENLVIISKRKKQILRLLSSPKMTSDIAKSLGVSWKSSYGRLNELKKLNLVKKVDNLWKKTPTNKKVIIY